MSKTIEETAEHIVKSIFGSEHAGQEYDFVVNILQERDRIAREEAIKECVEIAKEEERHAVGLLALVPQTIVRRLEELPRADITSDK